MQTNTLKGFEGIQKRMCIEGWEWIIAICKLVHSSAKFQMCFYISLRPLQQVAGQYHTSFEDLRRSICIIALFEKFNLIVH